MSPPVIFSKITEHAHVFFVGPVIGASPAVIFTYPKKKTVNLDIL
jgi:hypothetical protein